MSIKWTALIVTLACVLLTSCGTPEERAADYLVKAQELYEQEDYVSARIEAMNAAQIEPRNARVRYLLAQIEEQEQDFRKAVGHLQVAVDADPDFLDARIKLGNYYVLARAVEEASEQTYEALRLEPGNPEVMLLEARVAFLQDNLELANEKIEAALARQPGMIDAIMFKAGLMMSNDNVEKAMQITDEAMQKADTEGALQLRKFRILLLRTAERYDEIEAELNALADEYPDDETIRLSLAQLYVTLGRIDEAEAIFRDYVDSEPNDVARRVEFTRFIGTHRGAEAAKETLQGFIAELPDAVELKMALGRLEQSFANFDEAFAIFNQIAATTPTTANGYEARNQMAVIKIRQNDVDAARQIISSILVDDQNNADALLVRAAFAFTDRNYNDAVADLRTVLRERPESERALLLLARSHTAADNRELAQDAYRRLIDLNPNNSVAASELSDLLSRSGDTTQAEEVLREQLEADPKDRAAAARLVQNLIVQGNLEEAESQARSMLELEDPTGLAEFQLARVLQARQANQEAIDAYKQALSKNPTAPEPLQGLIAILANSNRGEEALTFLDKHMQEHPDLLVPWLLKAAVHARLGDIDAAAAAYDTLIDKQPDSIRAYASMASMYPDDADKRRAVYRRGIDANPKNSQIALLLASDYEVGGETEKALEIYEQILSFDPENVIASNNLAAILLDNRSDKASFERALEIAKRFENIEQPALLDTLGWAYYRNGDYGNAIRVLERAVGLNDKIALLRYHLGMAFVKADMTTRGRAELEKALSLAEEPFTGIEVARDTLARL